MNKALAEVKAKGDAKLAAFAELGKTNYIFSDLFIVHHNHSIFLFHC